MGRRRLEPERLGGGPLARAALLVALGSACGGRGAEEVEEAAPEEETRDPYRSMRMDMVERQIRARGISDERVLAALRDVPREEFVPEELRGEAYGDSPLPIGHGQTISQPYVVAFMTEALELEPGDRVLEIGTGSGYQAAILGRLVDEVYSIEIVSELARSAERTLKRLGFDNVHVRAGDGYRGWPEAAPFDAIIVTAAPDHVPQPLVDQLADGGSLVLPVGGYAQDLVLLRKTGEGLTEERILPVRFVPMTGEARERR